MCQMFSLSISNCGREGLIRYDTGGRVALTGLYDTVLVHSSQATTLVKLNATFNLKTPRTLTNLKVKMKPLA